MWPEAAFGEDGRGSERAAERGESSSMVSSCFHNTGDVLDSLRTRRVGDVLGEGALELALEELALEMVLMSLISHAWHGFSLASRTESPWLHISMYGTTAQSMPTCPRPWRRPFTLKLRVPASMSRQQVRRLPVGTRPARLASILPLPHSVPSAQLMAHAFWVVNRRRSSPPHPPPQFPLPPPSPPSLRTPPPCLRLPSPPSVPRSAYGAVPHSRL